MTFTRQGRNHRLLRKHRDGIGMTSPIDFSFFSSSPDCLFSYLFVGRLAGYAHLQPMFGQNGPKRSAPLWFKVEVVEI
jgi:hypothetical protein